MKHQLIMPSSLDNLRNAIMEKLIAISDKDYLVNLNKRLESKVDKNLAQDNLREEVLPKHVIEGIKRGQADIEAGRYITFEVFKEKLSAK